MMEGHINEYMCGILNIWCVCLCVEKNVIVYAVIDKLRVDELELAS